VVPGARGGGWREGLDFAQEYIENSSLEF